jgi:hypothetical protein
MPEQVYYMGTLIIIDGDETESYLFINYTKGQEKIGYAVRSDVPLIGTTCNHRAGCYSGLDCYKCDIDRLVYKEGINNVLIETIPGWNSLTVVNISHTTW